MEVLTPYANMVLVKSLAEIPANAYLYENSVTYSEIIGKLVLYFLEGKKLKLSLSLEISERAIINVTHLIIAICSLLAM